MKQPGSGSDSGSHKKAGFLLRWAAVLCLQKLFEKRWPLDLCCAFVLKKLPPEWSSPAGAPLRAHLHRLCTETLRWWPISCAVKKQFLERPLPASASWPRSVLCLGITELLFLETPPHAVLDLCGDVAGSLKPTRPYKGLVNAVLRRVLQEGRIFLETQDTEQLFLPPWLWTSWRAAYGEETTRASVRLLMRPPPLDLSLSVQTDEACAEWAVRLGGSVFPTRSIRFQKNPSLGDLPGYAEGAWWVQAAAATLPVHALGLVKEKDVLELCAAPGGKTALLAALGARVQAVDHSAQRLARLKENLARLGLTVPLIQADLLSWTPSAPVDLILLDAPCSATGTARRHPDVLRLKTPKEVKELALLQAQLLERVSHWLRPGGRLVYAVCSLQPEEGIAQITQFLSNYPAFKRLPIHPTELPSPELEVLITREGDVQSLPNSLEIEGGMDGFFISRLQIL